MRKQYDFSSGKKGAVLASPGKTRITIMLDDDIIEYYRAKGTGYQTVINAALRATLKESRGKSQEDRPLTVAVLRKVLREELHTS